MPANLITAVGGNTVNGATSYKVAFPAGDPLVRRKSVQSSSRRNQSPLTMSRSYEPLEFKLLISAADMATAYATFKTNVEQWFSAFGLTTTQIVANWHDGTSVYVDVEIIELRPLRDAGVVQSLQYEARCWAAYPIWQAASATASGPDPATVDNDGNEAVRPSIALTTTTHKTRRACTVTPVSGWPVTAYPIEFDLSDSAATSTNVFVYVNGVLVPCYVTGGGGASSAVWALVDCADDGTPTYVEIYYGSGLTNPLCGALSAGGMRSASGNSSWEWDEWAITTYPNYAGQWRPDNLGNHHTSATIKYRITDTTASTIVTLATSGVSTFDAMSLRVPAGWDSTSTSIDGLSRTTANLDGTNAQAFVRALYKGSASWVDLWTTRSNAAVTTDINGTDGAIMLCAGLENDGATNDPSTLTLTDAGGVNRTRVDLVSSTTPAVVVGAATDVDYYNGTYEIGDYTLTFVNTFVPDGTLTIDCQEKTISSSASGPIINLPTFSDPSIWAALEPGSNTITDGIGATDEITHRDGYG